MSEDSQRKTSYMRLPFSVCYPARTSNERRFGRILILQKPVPPPSPFLCYRIPVTILLLIFVIFSNTIFSPNICFMAEENFFSVYFITYFK